MRSRAATRHTRPFQRMGIPRQRMGIPRQRMKYVVCSASRGGGASARQSDEKSATIARKPRGSSI
eukprot:2044698-Prymnesium_polylepis.2